MYPRSQAVPTSSIRSLAICKYGGGRPGRFGHVQLYVVMSGRQRVDTWGWQRVSEPFLVLSVQGLEARALSRQSQYHPSFIVPGTIWHEMGITTVGHRPPYIYHLSTWHNRMWPNLSGLPPLYLHTVSDEILEVGTAWERGHGNLALLSWTSLCLKSFSIPSRNQSERACM